MRKGQSVSQLSPVGERQNSRRERGEKRDGKTRKNRRPPLSSHAVFLLPLRLSSMLSPSPPSPPLFLFLLSLATLLTAPSPRTAANSFTCVSYPKEPRNSVLYLGLQTKYPNSLAYVQFRTSLTWHWALSNLHTFYYQASLCYSLILSFPSIRPPEIASPYARNQM